jgi:hypothetical protein
MLLVSIGLARTLPDTGTTLETGYVSDFRYINAFFGSMLPLPHDADFHELPIPSDGNSHFVFGLQAQRKGLTVLWVQAIKARGSPTDEAQKAAAGPKGNRTKRIEIGTREFWKAESEEKSRAGKMHNVTYATAMSGYTLQFTVLAFDAKLGDELLRSIESIPFFDPAQAKALAGSNARQFPGKPQGTSTALATATHIGQLKLGVVSGNTITNDTLGFSFQFPAGWVLADKTTQENVVKAGHQFAWGNDLAAAREHEVLERCSKILFWATKYPEGTKTDEINPLIAILAFDSACFPGVDLPKSTEDTDGIRQVAIQISRSLSGTPFIGKGRHSVSAFTLQTRLLVDLSSAFQVEAPTRRQPVDVFTSIILTQANGYWVMWMFMNGSQSGLDELKRDIKFAFAPSVSGTGQK